MKLIIDNQFFEDLLDYLATVSMKGKGLSLLEIDALAELIKNEQLYAEEILD